MPSFSFQKVLLLGIALLLFPLILGATTDQSDVAIIVDGDAPQVTIHSPRAINYGTLPLLVNFTVIEPSLDKIWYTLNFGPNITIQSSFFINLSEGNYTLRIYANDSFKRIGFAEVKFSVNNSLPYCGNTLCEASVSESCTTCALDCGSCSAPPNGGSAGGGGGGGGGGGSIIPGGTSNGTTPLESGRVKIVITSGVVTQALVPLGQEIALEINGQTFIVVFQASANGLVLQEQNNLHDLTDEISEIKIGENIFFAVVESVEPNRARLLLSADPDLLKDAQKENASRKSIAIYFIISTLALFIIATFLVIFFYFLKHKAKKYSYSGIYHKEESMSSKGI